jgi:PAS domain S-box-containing protein
MSNTTKQLFLIFSVIFFLLLLLGVLIFNVASRFKESTTHIQEQIFPEIITLNQIEYNGGLRKLLVLHFMLTDDPAKKKDHLKRINLLTIENDTLFERISLLITSVVLKEQLNIVKQARAEYQEQTGKIFILFQEEVLPDPADYEENILRPFYLGYLEELSTFHNMLLADASLTMSEIFVRADRSKRLVFIVIIIGLIFLVITAYKIFGLLKDLKADYRKQKDFNKLLEERMYFLTESMPFMVWTADPQGNINYYSKKWEDYTGFDIETLKSEGWIKIVHPDFLEPTKEIYMNGILNKTFLEMENSLRRQDGNYRYCMNYANPMLDKNGDVIMWVGATVDIHEKKMSEQILISSHEDLKKLNSELDDFVYSISHDFRAPLTNIMGMAYMGKDLDDKSLKNEVFDKIHTSAKRLDTYITNVLDYSKNTRLLIEKEEINFEDLINGAKNTYNFLPGFEKIEMKFDLKARTTFYSDKKRLEAIFNNLISNAIKYADLSKVESYIYISIKVTTKEAVISIEDNGIGINKEHLDKIFDIFYKASAYTHGSGLGLYIVKEIIERLKGNIKVISEPGVGTSFIINIPNQTLSAKKEGQTE